MRALLLDNTFFPVRIIGWKKAIILLLSQRAEIIDEYPDKKVRSVSSQFNLPRILKLNRKHYLNRTVKFNRFNVFMRDNFKCQYCSIKLPPSKLTFDHVVPQSRSGPTTWENVVACCTHCNVKKGDQTLEQAGMKLRTIPKRPKWTPAMALKIKEDDPLEWRNWIGPILHNKSA